MRSRFHRNLLLALFAVGVVLQAFAVYVILFVTREGYIEAEGKDTASLAAIAARVINQDLLDAARTLDRYDLPTLRPADGPASLAVPRPIIAEEPGAERRYLIERETKRILWGSTDETPASGALEEALAKTSSEVVAVVPSIADRSVLFARRLPPSGESPVGFIVVAISAERVLSPAISVLGRSSPFGVLLADSTGQVLANTVAAELPPDFYARPFTEITFAGRTHLAAPARIVMRSSPGAFWSIVVVRDLEDALAAYQSTRDSVIALEAIFLVLVAGASIKIAQHFAASLSTLIHGLELMVGANPEHRIALAPGDEMETLAQYINRLADISGTTKSELEQEVASATRTIAFEKEKLASILFSLAEGVIVCDRDLRVVLCNKAARSILTTTWRPARRGKGIYTYLDAARLKPLVDTVGDRPRAMKQGTFTLANGAIIHATAVAVGDDEEKNYIFLLRDITQLVNLDRQRNRTINEMLQSLRGPLSSLLSFTDILLDYKGLDETRKNSFLAIMREEAERLSERLDEMQGRAEATLSPIEWSMEEVDLGSLAHQAAEQLQSLASDRSVQLAAVGEGAVVRGDVISLQQLVRRLFEFCIGFAGEGKRVEARWGEVEGGWVEFKLAYEGRSLSPEEMEGIFENPLYIGSGERGNLPTPRDVATIREIIKQHGGEAWAKNSERGASLAFILPAKITPLVKRVDSESDTVGKQITALLGDGSFYDFRINSDPSEEAKASALLSELSYVVIDLETTGLRPREGDEVVSVAGIRIERGEIVKEDYFYTLVNPRRPIPASATRVHGITDDMVMHEPVIEDVIPRFIEFQGDSVLAGHFVSFDLSFLKPKIPPTRRALRADTVLDTLMLSYALFKDWEGYNLEDLADRLGVKVVARHTALGDAYVTAQILIQLMKVMEGRGIKTLGEALRLQSGDILGKFLPVVRSGNGSGR